MHSERALDIHRPAYAFAFGDVIGVRMISVPSAVNTVSKPSTNLVSRSRMRNRGARPSYACPPPATSAAPEPVESSTTRLDGRGRQPGVPGGCRPRSRTDTYSVLSSTVSTMKKLVARMPAACARRNARQIADARRGADDR
jgi:hypothetical protein